MHVLVGHKCMPGKEDAKTIYLASGSKLISQFAQRVAEKFLRYFSPPVPSLPQARPSPTLNFEPFSTDLPQFLYAAPLFPKQTHAIPLLFGSRL